jgi:uncharacterized protein YbjT (DUF2867 family)
VLDEASLLPALEGVHTAFYFVHSMGTAHHFEELDRKAAFAFGKACQKKNVKRIVYLGGLGDTKSLLSPHLKSRHEVGKVLASSGVPVLEFRASIIIGSGSLSFELVRALVERLPIMVTPLWVRAQAQPIAIEDVLLYLQEAIHIPMPNAHWIVEIGGPEKCSYSDLMKFYASERKLKRWMIPVPVLTPKLSALWLGFVTPIYARIGRKLIESLRFPTVVNDFSSAKQFSVQPRGIREAIHRALRQEDQEWVQTRWADAISSSGVTSHWGGVRFESRLVDSRHVDVEASIEHSFAVIRRIGGAHGWYFATFLWKLRGYVDLLLGGVGLRRGRRDPHHLRVGDALDFWRVEVYEPNHRLRLQAEMKVPGRAWLEFVVEPVGDTTRIFQTAIFDPYGLWGLLYWYGIYPLHQYVFAGMLRAIAEKVKKSSSQTIFHEN